MGSLLRSLIGGGEGENRDMGLSFQDWVNMFQFNGLPYGVVQSGGTPGQKGEGLESNFQGYVNGAYKANGVVFACMAARQLLFSEARFQFQALVKGRPGDLFGTPELDPLHEPWTGANTGDLLTAAILDYDLAGNFYAVRRPGGKIRRLRPDWVTIIAGSRSGQEIDSEVIGYSYQPGGPASGEDPVVLLPEEVAHFRAYPDPLARFRGLSWLGPIVGEILGDQAATTHKQNFFENGTKLGYVVTLGENMTPDKFDTWVSKFKAGHDGTWNAYKTLFLSAGADVKTVGTNLQEVDFKKVQGAGETRICAAARVPAIIVGVSEGLESATYSNYGQARRAFADLTMRPMWRNIAGSLARLVNVPAGTRLWYDDRDVPFLQEDLKDAADIQQTQAITIRELINAGYEPDTVIKAVANQDFSLLKHTGLVSVQLQEPGAQQQQVGAGSQNGNGQPLLPASTS
jgi:HK97 family phage portal protein